MKFRLLFTLIIVLSISLFCTTEAFASVTSARGQDSTKIDLPLSTENTEEAADEYTFLLDTEKASLENGAKRGFAEINDGQQNIVIFIQLINKFYYLGFKDKEEHNIIILRLNNKPGEYIFSLNALDETQNEITVRFGDKVIKNIPWPLITKNDVREIIPLAAGGIFTLKNGVPINNIDITDEETKLTTENKSKEVGNTAAVIKKNTITEQRTHFKLSKTTALVLVVFVAALIIAIIIIYSRRNHDWYKPMNHSQNSRNRGRKGEGSNVLYNMQINNRGNNSDSQTQYQDNKISEPSEPNGGFIVKSVIAEPYHKDYISDSKIESDNNYDVLQYGRNTSNNSSFSSPPPKSIFNGAEREAKISEKMMKCYSGEMSIEKTELSFVKVGIINSENFNYETNHHLLFGSETSSRMYVIVNDRYLYINPGSFRGENFIISAALISGYITESFYIIKDNRKVEIKNHINYLIRNITPAEVEKYNNVFTVIQKGEINI